MIFDTHAHLTSESVLPVLTDVIERARCAGVSAIVNICTDEKSLQEGLQLHKAHPWIAQAAATTPHDVEKEGASFFPFVERAAKAGQLAAIGETGLDACYEHSCMALQREWLLRYFALAKEVKLPLIFHCREAFADLFAHADREYRDLPAVLHCFTGTLEEACGVLERGWLVSISGIVTFKKSHSLREVVKGIPLDRLVIETDTPYLAPEGKRGKMNEPQYLIETARCIAQLKAVTVEEVLEKSYANAMKFFSLSKRCE